jgi:RNA polymerase sigma factor (sigma-70 family)
MSAEATSDVPLVTAARGGDGAAYAELFERYHSRIFNYAYGLAGNREDAGDIAQEAFVRVFEALPRLTGDLNFSAYLYRTAHNVGIDTVKHRGRFAPADALEVQREPSLRTDPERVTLLQEQQEQTWGAAFRLSDKHREILTLRELHDMSYQDIADVLDMPRTTVGVLLSRARLKFKEAFRMSSVDIDKLAEECRELLPLLSAYIDDELDPAERAQVEVHLDDCAFCRLALEEMTEASRSYRALLPLLPPAALKDGVWTRIGDLLSPDEAQAAPQEQAQAAPQEQAQAEPTGQPRPTDGPRPTDASESTGGSQPGGSEWTAGAKAAMKPTAGRHSVTKVVAASAAGILVVLLSGWLAAGLPGLPGSGEDAEQTVASTPEASANAAVTTGRPPSSSLYAVDPSTTSSTSMTLTTTSNETPASTAPETTTPRSTPAGDEAPAPAPSSSPPPPTGTGPGVVTPGQPQGPAAQDPTGAGTAEPTQPAADTPTQPPDAKAPPAPRLIAPANGAIVKGGKVTLQWEPVKDPSGVTYRVEIQSYDDKAGGYLTSRTVDGVSGTKLSHSMKSSRERWRVSAVDGAGNKGPVSEWWKMGQEIELLVPLKPVETTTLY